MPSIASLQSAATEARNAQARGIRQLAQRAHHDLGRARQVPLAPLPAARRGQPGERGDRRDRLDRGRCFAHLPSAFVVEPADRSQRVARELVLRRDALALAREPGFAQRPGALAAEPRERRDHHRFVLAQQALAQRPRCRAVVAGKRMRDFDRHLALQPRAQRRRARVARGESRRANAPPRARAWAASARGCPSSSRRSTRTDRPARPRVQLG